ncbi:uncharacterized protein [Clytia hemisphaerica]|uniref:uncharacterized protein n=1 Tax=Clytia hemisphaerica TaxID=252671 RepID=UPI0034D4134D
MADRTLQDIEYCHSCRSIVLPSYVFCKQCGVPTRKEECTLTDFESHRKRKLAKTRPSSTKKTKPPYYAASTSTSTSTLTSSKDVSVNVGFASYEESIGTLKPRRGRMSVTIKDSCNAIDLKYAAIDKYSKHDQNFCGLEDYVLLYPDFTRVFSLRGSRKPFTVKDYKVELNQPYSKCIFLLCLKTDFDHVFNNLKKDNTSSERSSESDSENQPCKNDQINNNDHYVPPPEPIYQELLPNVEEHHYYVPDDDANPPDTSGDVSRLMPNVEIKTTTDKRSTANNTTAETQALPTIINLEETLPYVDSYESKRETILNLLKSSEELFTLTIRRRKIYLDTMQKLKIHWAENIKPFKVKFIGDSEEADGSGVLREFFSLFFDDARNHILATGSSDNCTFLHITEKMKSKEYHYFGNLISLALINGFAGPRYFLPGIACRLLNVEFILPNYTDIPYFEVAAKLEALVNCENEAFQNLIENFTERFAAGVTKPKVQFAEKNDFIKDISFHFCMSTCSEETEQVADGMQIFGFRTVMQQHLENSFNELIRPVKQSTEDLLEVYKEKKYSEDIERKTVEEDIVYNFTNFVESFHHVKQYKRKVYSIEDAKEVDKIITFPDVFRFCSGSKFVLDSMKGKGTIKFVYPSSEKDKARHIEAYTCALMIVIPVNQRYIDSQTFIESFCEDILSSPGFGKR